MNRWMPMMLGALLLAGSAFSPADARTPSAKTPGALAPSDERVVVLEPWVREAPPGARVLGAYMTLQNPGERADRLLEVKSASADSVEIHRMVIKNGMMEMEAIPFLTVPAQGEVKLRPGGTHLMIYGMKRELKEGDRLSLELTFEQAGTRTIDFPVRKYMRKP